ncbi:winged helix-turn-helix transcriptional regulator [Viridibacillus arvi]
MSEYEYFSISLADICKGVNINKSTCHRILKVLENHNLKNNTALALTL